MTDSILRSYQFYTTTTLIPYPVPVVPPPLASDLLVGETDGFAIDATTYDEATAAAYVGGPVGGTVAVINTGDPTDDLDDVPINASNLTNAGTSPKMVHHAESPYVRWSPHNITQQSQTFDNAFWAKSNGSITADATTAPDGTSTADKWVEASDVGQDHYLWTGLTFVSGYEYTLSWYVKAAERTWVQIKQDTVFPSVTSFFNLSDGTIGATTGGSPAIVSVGSGWYRISHTVTCNSSSTGYFYILLGSADNTTTYNGNGTSGVYVWGMQINRGPIATPYMVTTSAARYGIAQHYDAALEQYGMLIESAKTNICLGSETLSNGTLWANNNQATVTADATTAPNDASAADKIVEAASVDVHFACQIIEVSTTTQYTFSIYLKAAERTTAQLQFCGSAFEGGVVTGEINLTTGVITGTPVAFGTGWTLGEATITSIGNDWHRVTLTGTTASNGTIRVVAQIQSGSYSGNGTSGIYAWGAQLESGGVATSYIPTVSASVTRATEDVSLLLSSIAHGTTKNSAYVDMKQIVAGPSSPTIWVCHDGSNSNRIGVYTDGSPRNFMQATTLQVDDDFGTMVSGVRTQLSSSYQANDCDASQDGAALVSDPSGTFPSGMTTLAFGGVGGSSTPNGLYYRFLYVPRQVQTEDGTLTTWRYNF